MRAEGEIPFGIGYQSLKLLKFETMAPINSLREKVLRLVSEVHFFESVPAVYTRPRQEQIQMSTPWSKIPVQLADLKEYGSSRSSANGKPICAQMSTDPCGSVLVQTGPNS